MKSGMDRARFAPPRESIWTPHGDNFNVSPFNFLQHNFAHPTVIFTYTSKATLDTNASTPWYPPQDFVIETVQANVSGAPSGADLVWDVLVGGASIFTTTAERPHIKSGDLVGRIAVPSRQGLQQGAKLQAQGITISSATGPLVLTFQLTAVS